jgi:hypothetical protein
VTIASALVIGAWLVWRATAGPEVPAVPAVSVSPGEPADGGVRRAAAARAGELPLASGEAVTLEAAALEAGTPVALRVFLGEPSKTAEPLAVRVYAADGRANRTQGLLGGDRLDARVEIDPAWLAPGRNIVEVVTTERSHFPMRRYAIELR